MKQEESLMPKSDKRGIKGIINNVVELIKSKTDKNYILSESSPEFLKRNKDLILKTIQVNQEYLNQVPDDILLEELLQQQLPSGGIIDTAFRGGYSFDKNTTPILIGENAKKAMLQYIEIQKEIDNNKGDYSFTLYRINCLFKTLNESLLQDVEFREKLFDSAIENGYRISQNSPQYIKQNGRFAEIYYRELLENNTEGILKKNILSPELLRNKSFLENYINLLKQKGIKNETIIDSLTYNQDCINALKNDSELFRFVFETITPTNLQSFFDKFFSKEELKLLFADDRDLQGKLLRVSQLYNKDNTILQSLNGRMLEDKYQSIPNYKMQLIAKMPTFQDAILGLNDYEYSLYNRMVQVVSKKTARWNRFEKNIVENLSDGYYGELIRDLYEQDRQGNHMSDKELETLTFLFSRENISKSYWYKYYRDQGMDDESIKKEELSYSNNTFNITSKKELEYFEEIKELVCDTILTNPELDDEQLITPIKKYLGLFGQLSELDRMKLALLQKYYNIDLKEAGRIVDKFSTDIDNITANNEYQENIIEQIKAIKNIFESNDIEILKKIGDLDILVRTDLSPSTFLIEEAEEIFEQLYKENLYMPKEEDRVGSTTYNGKRIEIFNANTDFSMIVKRVGTGDENSQEVWNYMTKFGRTL